MTQARATNPVGWFEIYVDDMGRAKKFYETVFDTTLQDMAMPGIDLWAFPMSREANGASGALIRMEGFSGGGNSTLVYFTCDDVAVEAARIRKAGGRLYREKESIGEHGFIALGYDTEGNMFGLHSLK